jgi:aminoglycoside phosphotransferase (APT) family kinase protein
MDKTKKEVNRWREKARQLIVHHFGSKPKRIIYKASGLTNFVFAAKHSEGDFIVRLSPDATRLNDFFKEQWAEEKASEAGVPTAKILEVGNEVVPHPYMITHAVEGSEATFNENRLEIVREMGRYAALINSIPTDGYGNTFNWSNNRLSRNETFDEYVEDALEVEKKLEILEKHKMISPAKKKSVRKIFDGAKKMKPKPRLTHGDLRLKNVIVTDEGKINAIIDWENCTSNIAPHWELSIALHDLWIDEKQAFLEGYGINQKKFAEIAPLIKAFNLINYASVVEKMAKDKDKKKLEEYRARLGGALDLYSFDS